MCMCMFSGKEFTCNAWDLGREDPLEEEMAIHSSIFAWKIPGAWQTTVHNIDLQRVGHNWVTEHTYIQ